MSKALFGPATTLQALPNDRDELAPEAEAVFAALVSSEQPDAERDPIAVLSVHVSASRHAQRVANRSARIDGLARFRRKR